MALKYYAGDRITGTNSDRSGLTTTNVLAGTSFLETDTNDLYHWDGSGWDLVAGNTVAETLTLKTLTTPTISSTGFANAVHAHAASNSGGTVAASALTGDVALGSKTSGNYVATITGGTGLSSSAASSGEGTTHTLTVGTTQAQVVEVGALNAGSITSGFGNINIGASTFTTTGAVAVGSLTVGGSTTRIESTVTTIVDPIIHLQTTAAGGALTGDTNKDVGLALQYHTGSAAKTAFLGLDDTDKKLVFISDATINSEVTSGTTGTIKANLEGDVTGNVSGNITGTAAAGTLTGNTLASGVTASSLTTVGTLTTLTVDNVLINGATIGHTGDTDLMTVASGVLTVAGNLLPSADDTHDIGSASAAWQDLFLEGDITLTDAGTIATSAGNLSLDAAAGSAIRLNDAQANVDVVIESDAADNMFHADAGTGNLGLGGAAALGPKVRVYPNAAVGSYVNGAVFFDFSNSATTQITQNGDALFGADFKTFAVTGDSGTRTIIDGATVYIDGPPTAGSNAAITNPWSLWVDSGNARFDGNIDLNSSGTIINVGNSASDWTNGQLTVKQTANNTSLAGVDVTSNAGVGASMRMHGSSQSGSLHGVNLASAARFTANASGGIIIDNQADAAIYFADSGGITMTLDGNNNVLIGNGNGLVIGHTAQITDGTPGFAATFETQILGTGYEDSNLVIGRWVASSSTPGITFVKSRHGTIGSSTIVQNGDYIGQIDFRPDDGVDFKNQSARFAAIVDTGTNLGANRVPTAFVWSSQGSASDTQYERMRITSDGTLKLSTGGIDLNDQGSILNVGASGNDWDSTSLRVATDVFIANSAGMVIGHSAQLTVSAADGATARVPEFQIAGTVGTIDGAALITTFNTNGAGIGNGSTLNFAKSRGSFGTVGTAVGTSDALGAIVAYGDDGTDMHSPAAAIYFEVDGTVGSSVMPGKIEFYTTPASSTTLTKRMTINALGSVGIGVTPSNYPLDVLSTVTNRGIKVASNTSTHTAQIYVVNTVNNAANHSELRLSTNGASSGDARVVFDVNQAAIWTIGAKTSDDSFRIQSTSGVGLDDPDVTITAAGLVGIGVTPAKKLDVKATGDDLVIRALGSNGNVAAQIGATNTDEGYFDLLDGASTKVRISANMSSYFNGGNVGIGISPAYKFQVEAAVNSNWLSRIYNTGTTNAEGLLVRTADEDTDYAILGAYSGSSYKFKVMQDGGVTLYGGGNANTVLDIQVPGTGDPTITFTGAGTSKDWHIGQDNSHASEGLYIGKGTAVGTEAYIRLDSRTGAGNFLVGLAHDPGTLTVASASNARMYMTYIAGNTLTYTGGTQMTQLDGSTLYVDRPALVSGNNAAITIDAYNTIYTRTPYEGDGYVTLTTAAGIRISDGGNASHPATNNIGLLVESITSGTNDYAIYTEGATQSHFGGNVLMGSSISGIGGATRLHLEVSHLTYIDSILTLRNAGTGSTLAGTGVGLRLQVGDANAGPSDVGFIWGYTTEEAFGSNQYVAIRAGNVAPTTANGQLVVKVNGYVGMGIAAPLYQLVVNDPAGAGAKIQIAGGGVGSLYFADGQSGNAQYEGYIGYNHGSDYMVFGTAHTARVYIDSVGRFGIGTGTSPTELLTIKEQSDKSAAIAFLDTDNTNLGYIGVARATNAITTGTSNTDMVIRAYASAKTIFTDGTDINMVINASGNVGIGTGTSIDTKFHVEASNANIARFENTTVNTYGSGSGIANFVTTKARTDPGASNTSNQEGPYIAFHQQADGNLRDTGAIGMVAGSYHGTAGNAANLQHDMLFYSRSSGGMLERMRINYNGNVGIGDRTPVGGKLHITTAGSGAVETSIYLHHPHQSGYRSRISFANNYGGNTEHVASSIEGSSYLNFFVSNNSNVADLKALELASGDGDATFSNDINYSGDLTDTSDERVKGNIQTISGALGKIAQMRGVSYSRLYGNRASRVGLVAQELELIAPELVKTGDSESSLVINVGTADEATITGVKSVNYSKLTAYLIEAIKELKTEVDILKAS